jgi:hypothetical protein
MWYKVGSEVAQFMIWQGWPFLEVRKQTVLIPVKNYTGVQMDDVLRRTLNKAGSLLKVTLRRVRVTIFAVDNQ